MLFPIQHSSILGIQDTEINTMQFCSPVISQMRANKHCWQGSSRDLYKVLRGIEKDPPQPEVSEDTERNVQGKSNMFQLFIIKDSWFIQLIPFTVKLPCIGKKIGYFPNRKKVQQIPFRWHPYVIKCTHKESILQKYHSQSFLGSFYSEI